MHYREITPTAALRPYVKCLWFLRGEADSKPSSPDRILPDGSAEIVIHRAAPMIAHGLNTAPSVQPSALIVGQLLRCIFLQPTGDVNVVGIRFTPNGLYNLLGIPASELTDHAIELSQYRAAFAHELINAAFAFDDCIPRLQRVLLNLLPRRSSATDLVTAAIEQLVATNGALSIGELCRRLSISGRQLERRFDREVGLRPKQFARIIRFVGVVQLSEVVGQINGAHLAQKFGYADQSHLINDFRHFAGICPSAYFKGDPGLAALFSGGGDVAFLQD